MKRLIAFGIIVLLCLAAEPSGAGTISLQTSTTCTVTDQGVRVEVTVINAGDEAAADLRVVARCREAEKTSAVKTTLHPGREWTVRLLLQPVLPLPGAYPVEVRVDFHDRNGHSFSALSSGAFVHREGVHSLVFAQRAQMFLRGRGRLDMEVANTDESPHRITVRLVAPVELVIDPPQRTTDIQAGDRIHLGFDVANRSARTGADYPVMAFIEYEADGRHHVSISENAVRIGRPENIFKRHRTILFILTLALAAVVLLVHGLRPASRGRRE